MQNKSCKIKGNIESKYVYLTNHQNDPSSL